MRNRDPIMECFSFTFPKSSLPDYIKLKDVSGTSEDVYYSMACLDIPSEFKVIAEKELNENEENLNKGLRRLREFMKKEGLTEVDDFTLTAVLRCCKYSVKKSETKLKKFLKARESILSKMEGLDMKKVERIIEDGGIGLLPFRDRHGRAIVFTRADAMNDAVYSMEDAMVTGTVCGMLLLSFPLTSVAGVAYIIDCKFSNTVSYFSLLKYYHKYMWTFLDFPIRMGRVDIINEHFLARWFFSIVRSFVSSKILSRVTFFGSNLDELQKVHHPDILPEEFGGKMGPLDPSFYKDIVLDYIRKLKEESKALKGACK